MLPYTLDAGVHGVVPENFDIWCNQKCQLMDYGPNYLMSDLEVKLPL